VRTKVRVDKKPTPHLTAAMPHAALGVALAARNAQHTAGYFDNRHVEIVCAASARVNVSVILPIR
jgi:hypothetical protein